MATQIEFLSSIDGRDLVPCKASVWSTLKEIVRVFRNEGYSVSGNIEFVNRKYIGEYFAEGRGERVHFQVVNV